MSQIQVSEPLGFNALAWYRLLTVPRHSDDAYDPTLKQLTAAVTAAHALFGGHSSPGRLAALWVRKPEEPQLEFIVGGSPFFPAAREEAQTHGRRMPIAYPPGATGERVSAGAITGLGSMFPSWVRCFGVPDVLRSPDDVSAESAHGSFDDHVAHLHQAFAWLVVAEPLTRVALDRELTALSLAIPRLRSRENSELDRLELERSSARFRELTRARSSGMWHIRVIAGGETPQTAHAAAALLCSARDLEPLPYALLPDREALPLVAAVDASGETPEGGRSPFIGSTEFLAALTRPPSRELPGIRAVAGNHFDVTPEQAAGDTFRLGDVLDAGLSSAGNLDVAYASLNRHGFVCGATGSGKSQTVRSMLEALSRAERPVPWLVIEPAKAEYSRMRGRLRDHADVLVIQPGDLGSPPAGLNPLEPAEGYPLQSHLDLVRALFLAAFEAHEPFPQVLARSLAECYVAAGCDLVTSRPWPATKPRYFVTDPAEPAVGRYPSLGDLQATARRVVESIGYGREVMADVRGFVDVRIGSLREGRAGAFFERGHPIDIDALLRGNAVLEIEGITNDQDKAFLMGAVLIRIVEHLRVARSAGTSTLEHVLVLEEAHRLLKNAREGPGAAAVELFASILAEIRAYGEGIVVVEQIPSKILPDVIKNTAFKVMHRLPALDDREAVGGTMNLQPDQSEAVVALEPGTAAVALDGMDRPLLVRMDPGEKREGSDGGNPAPPLCGRRSLLCGGACRQRACTLEEINSADRGSREPVVVVWVEAVIAAHLIGVGSPKPTQAVRANLGERDARLLECTLAHAVDRAIQARHHLLRPYLAADDLAQRIIAVLHAQLSDVEPPHDPNPRRWTAGFYRWTDVRAALLSAIESNAGDNAPHRSTEKWRERDLHLEGRGPSHQLAELDLHPSYAEDQQWVATGDPDESQLREAVEKLTGQRTEDGFRQALRRSCEGPSVDQLVEQMWDLVAPPAMP